MLEQRCLFCGGDPTEANHWRSCDGRQGGREDVFDPRDAFGQPNYHAPFAKGRETSEAAADSVTPTAGTLCEKILCEIRHRVNIPGMTCAEVEDFFQLRHQTASARLWDLHTRGFIRDASNRRLTSSGRRAIVWVAA